MMNSKSTLKFCVVKEPGIYPTCDECHGRFTASSGTLPKCFDTREAAQAYMDGKENEAPLTRSGAIASDSFAVPDVKEKKRKVPDDDTPDDSGIGDSEDVVYSDGACKGNGQGATVAKAGIGAWRGPGDPRNIAERCPGDQTNNRAEFIAIIRILEVTPQSQQTLRIKTDSQYCINCVTVWLKAGSRTTGRNPMANLWRTLP
ncbi:ribonuclease H-like domain-containing protein [Mycena rosella]|uniref:ribonuclease H n=1 Tax=Mycena rosella TaxID=1033263 RepID=A0AAD7GGN2_MYCRO|nr:ribonuclease H-like domain-containing protein [Mycena rosella]